MAAAEAQHGSTESVVVEKQRRKPGRGRLSAWREYAC
jgi:hypothetical protein